MRNLLLFGFLDHILYIALMGTSKYSITLICIQGALLLISTTFCKENDYVKAFFIVTTLIVMIFNSIVLQTPIMYVATGIAIMMALHLWWTGIISSIGIVFITLKTDVYTICEILVFLSVSGAYILYLKHLEKKITKHQFEKIATLKRESNIYKYPLDISPNKEFEQTDYNIFKKLLTAFPDGVLILDNFNTVQFSNSAFRSLMNEQSADTAKDKLLNQRNAINSEQDNYKQLFMLLDRKITSRSYSMNNNNEHSAYIQLKSSHDQDEIRFHNDSMDGLDENDPEEVNYHHLSQTPIVYEEVKQIFQQMHEREQQKSDMGSQTLKFFQEISMVCSSDQQKILQIIFKPYLAYSKAHIMFIIRDITHVNQIAALEKMNFNKSQMLYKVAHEFKTPLNIIIQQVGTIFKNNKDNKLQKQVQPIKSMAESLLGLVNDLLDVAQLKAGKFNLIFQQVKLTELLNDIIDVMRIQANSKGLYMKLEQHKAVPTWVVTDPNRVKQIVLNLLSNAIKFTETGGIVLSVDYDGEYVEIKVSDTGIGIPPQDISQLFTAFGRLENSENITGVGLGLMISNILAQKLGQEIKVYSEGEDKGSTFSFKISCRRSIPFGNDNDSMGMLYDEDDEGMIHTLKKIPEMNYQRIRSPEETSLCKCIHVLIIDDVPFNISIIGQQLKALNIITDKAYSVKEALQKVSNYNGCIEHSNYKLILIDIEMPKIDGYQGAKLIKEIAPEAKIIGCSAHPQESVNMKYFSGYIEKPIDPQKVRFMLN